jgi:hypothetical protein
LSRHGVAAFAAGYFRAEDYRCSRAAPRRHVDDPPEAIHPPIEQDADIFLFGADDDA